MEQGPVQCRNGCGFYAGSGTDGLCSVCYKDMIKKKQQPPQGMPASLAPSEPRSTSGPATMASLSIDETSSPKTSSTAAVETASPTVIVPSSLQTEKVLIFHSQVLFVVLLRRFLPVIRRIVPSLYFIFKGLIVVILSMIRDIFTKHNQMHNTFSIVILGFHVLNCSFLLQPE